MTAQRPCQRPSSPPALQPCSRMPPSPPSPCGPVPASIDGSSSGFCGKWFRPLSFLFLRVGSALAPARCRPVRGGAGGVAPVDPGRGRLPDLGAIALQTRMRGPALIVDEPAFAQGVESLDHKGAPPPNTKSPVPRSSDEQVVTLVDSRPPMRPLAPSPLAPGSQPCPRRIAVRHRIRSAMRDAPGGRGPPPGAVMWSARSFRPLPRGNVAHRNRPGALVTKPRPDPGGTAHDPAMRRAPGDRMPWSPGPAPARGRHLAS